MKVPRAIALITTRVAPGRGYAKVMLQAKAAVPAEDSVFERVLFDWIDWANDWF